MNRNGTSNWKKANSVVISIIPNPAENKMNIKNEQMKLIAKEKQNLGK